MAKKDDAPKSLDPKDIEDIESPDRRSALSMVGTLIATAVFGAAVTAPSEAAACRRRTGITNSDPSDGVGRGRTGISDADSGDEGQCGRGGGGRRIIRRRRRCTDSDSGPGADGAGRGRRC